MQRSKHLTKRNIAIAASVVIVIAAVAIAAGHEAPSLPPQYSALIAQSNRLALSDASRYNAGRLAAYMKSVESAKQQIIEEQAGNSWFIDYAPHAERMSALIKEGEAIAAEAAGAGRLRASNIEGRAALIEETAAQLEDYAEGLTGLREFRKSIVKARLASQQARELASRQSYDTAEASIKNSEAELEDARAHLMKQLGRYTDESQVRQWREMVERTVRQSRKSGGYAIVVRKLDRKLELYKSGDVVRTFSVGLGKNGTADKFRAGDNATPEGAYKVIKKNPASKYYKALLINYPNEDDKRRFRYLKSKGRVPEMAAIGGLVEIHGGGSRSVTQGCVSLENDDMDALFRTVPVGTPVTIVGSTRVADALPVLIGKEGM